MSRISVVLVCAAFLWLCPAIVAANPGPEGEPHFGLTATFKDPPRLGESVQLVVRVYGEDTYRYPWTSITRISIPRGIDVISGDTINILQVVKRTRVKAERTFPITVRIREPGSYAIHGRLEIEADDMHGTDQTDFILPVTVSADSLNYARAPRTLRFENVRNGQRYRYAGPYLVPIDSTEALLQEEIEQKPRPLSEEPASCSGCPTPLPRLVPFAVMVGKDGRVRESRFLDIDENGKVDSAVIAAAAAVVSRWEFSPAMAKGRPVADFTVVRVPIKNGSP